MRDEETIFPAGPTVPGQSDSRRAYRDLLANLETFPWWNDYRELVERGWDWRKAVYIAWSASPAKSRIPATQMELAQQVLGLHSDRVISKWREKQPEMLDEIVRMQAAPLLRHRRDIYDALATSASDPDPKSHSDRKLALEMLGDYKPRQVQQLEGGDTPIETKSSVTHALDSETAGEVFDILASLGLQPTGDDDAAADELHSVPADS